MYKNVLVSNWIGIVDSWNFRELKFFTRLRNEFLPRQWNECRRNWISSIEIEEEFLLVLTFFRSENFSKSQEMIRKISDCDISILLYIYFFKLYFQMKQSMTVLIVLFCFWTKLKSVCLMQVGPYATLFPVMPQKKNSTIFFSNLVAYKIILNCDLSKLLIKNALFIKVFNSVFIYVLIINDICEHLKKIMWIWKSESCL